MPSLPWALTKSWLSDRVSVCTPSRGLATKQVVRKGQTPRSIWGQATSKPPLLHTPIPLTGAPMPPILALPTWLSVFQKEALEGKQ